MNELIKNIFTDFEVDGVPIPVKFLYYYGHGEPYVIYQKESLASGLLADDELQNYVEYYDFDVYSTGNYKNIVESVKNKLTQNNFLWEPTRSSGDLYDADTGYYHITLNFSYLRGE